MTELAKADQPKPSALATMAHKFDVEPKQLLSTLKDTAFRGATDSQMMALCVVANEYGLNPFTKEIYAFPDKKGGGIIPVIGVDGWYSIVNSHADYNGCEFSQERDGQNLISFTCKIHRKSREHPTEVTEYLEECKRNSDPWNKQPTRMLRHRSFVQCARIAFGISATDPEDAARMEDYAKARDVTPTERENPFKEAIEIKGFNELFEESGIPEAVLLIVLSDFGICLPETTGIDALSDDQKGHAATEWAKIVVECGKGATV